MDPIPQTTVMELKATNFEGNYFTKVSESWNALEDKQVWKDKASAIIVPQVIAERKKIRIQEPWV